jgi:hypothetical protein
VRAERRVGRPAEPIGPVAVASVTAAKARRTRASMLVFALDGTRVVRRFRLASVRLNPLGGLGRHPRKKMGHNGSPSCPGTLRDTTPYKPISAPGTNPIFSLNCLGRLFVKQLTSKKVGKPRRPPERYKGDENGHRSPSDRSRVFRPPNLLCIPPEIVRLAVPSSLSSDLFWLLPKVRGL